MTHAPIVEVRDVRLEEQAREQRRDVRRVRREEDDAERAPHVDEHLVRPGLGGLEGDEVAEEQAPHDPEGGSDGEVLVPLPPPRIEAEGAEPLVDGGGHGRHVETDEDRDPQIRTERSEEREERSVDLTGRSEERHARIVKRRREVDVRDAIARDA